MYATTNVFVQYIFFLVAIMYTLINVSLYKANHFLIKTLTLMEWHDLFMMSTAATIMQNEQIYTTQTYTHTHYALWPQIACNFNTWIAIKFIEAYTSVRTGLWLHNDITLFIWSAWQLLFNIISHTTHYTLIKQRIHYYGNIIFIRRRLLLMANDLIHVKIPWIIILNLNFLK